MASPHDIDRIADLDRELVSIVRDFLILGPLSWPMDVQRAFLKGAEKGKFVMPKVEYPKVDYREKITALTAFIKKITRDSHPAIDFLIDTAESYLSAYILLQNVGTPQVTEQSKILYGSPSETVKGYKLRNIDVARYFLRVVSQYHGEITNEPLIYSAAQFQKVLQKLVAEHIDLQKDPIEIRVDDNITARATAGPNYVKVRKAARFSEADLLQLLHHEVLTHTLTYINGRKQPVLTCMGYSAPRITATQEGLAVFSEYINLSVELVRLKRIALRILAIDMAENKADLVDLFRFFKGNGQDDEESYYSAMRILRGGQPTGGIIFYKDNVYLRGLIEVAGFLKQAMHHGMVHDINILFAGKMTTADVARLHPLIDEGYIVPSAYIPRWAARSGELAAHLAFNDLTERFKMK